MDIQDVIKFANEIGTCYLATIDEDKPRVRGMRMWKADKDGFWFHTGITKNLCKQLKKNPKIEISFYNNAMDLETMRMLRVNGEVEFVDDTGIKLGLMEERPFLKAISTTETLMVFKIYKGEAWFWTMKDNLDEDGMERVKF